MRMFLLLLGLSFIAHAANAACSNPTGNAGDMTYSTSANVMAYCDSTNWISMAGGVSLTVNTSGGGATPAGSTADVQFNSSGVLAADTGNFTYSSGLLKAPNISTTAITATGAGTFGTLNSSGLGTLGSLIVTGGATITGQASITTISTSLIQIGNGNGAACTAGLAGAQRYNSTSNTIDYCSGSAWLSLGPSSTQPISFYAYRNATQTVTANTLTKIALNAEVFDTNNNFDTSANRFTPTVPGKYLVIGAVQCTDSGTNYCKAYIYKNGSAILEAVTAGYDYGEPKATTIVDMNGTTDYIELYGLNAAGTQIRGLSTTTYMQAVLLSPQGSGTGGTATPAGSTADVQFNSGGLLAADTGNFTYTSSTLKTPSLLTGGITVTGQASLTTVSSTLVQLISNTTTACTSNLAGAQRYNSVSNTIDYCTGTAWMSLGPSATAVPSFSANKIAASQSIADSTYTKVTFENIEFNKNNNYDSSTNRFTVTVPGTYIFSASLRYAPLTTGDSIYTLLYKNGFLLKAVQQRAGGTSGYSVNLTALDSAAVGDYYEIYAYQLHGSAMNILNTSGGYTYFAASLITMGGGGSSGTANPAGSTNDVQFNSGGLLAADTGNFTYASSTLKTPSLLTGGITATGQASLSTVSSTLVQLISNTATACTSSLAGAQRYNSVSNTIDYCSGSAWLSLGPSATVDPAVMVTMSANQTITPLTQTLLNLDAKTFDTNNNFDTATQKFTPTIPGYYQVNVGVTCMSATNISNACVSYIFKNGSIISSMVNRAGSTTYQWSSTNSIVVYMNGTTDYLQLKGYTEATGGVIQGGSSGPTYFSAALLTMNGGGTGGTANPAGSTADIQFNTGGLLDADSAKFTYTKATGTVSVTTISTTTANFVSASTYANVVGGLGNMIASGSAVVSTSSAGSITFYAGGSQRMMIDGASGYVGIGTSTSAYPVTVSGSGFSLTNGYKQLRLEFGGANDLRSINADLYINNAVSNPSNTIINGGGGSVYIGTNTNPTALNGNPELGIAAATGMTGLNIKGSGAQNVVNLWYPTAGGGTMINFHTGTTQTAVGTIASNGSATAYNTTSDRRVKENITDTREGLQKLMEIGVKDFSFRADPSHTIVNGFIAQDLEHVYPEAVTTNGDNGVVPLKDKSKIWQVDYGRVTPLIVKAVQDLKREKDNDIANLTARLKAANDNISVLRQEVEELKKARR